MAFGKDERFQIVTAGAERSGKTYFTAKFAEKYAGSGAVMVYNPGNPRRDFTEYQVLDFLPVAQSVEVLGIPAVPKHRSPEQEILLRSVKFAPTFLHFRLNDKVYSVENLNAVLYRNRRTKVFRQSSLIDEGKFFKTIHDFCSGLLLINDDFRSVARNMSDQRLSPLLELYSTKNHCGKLAAWKPQRQGVDIINIFHHPDKVNAEIYDYTTHVLLFNITRAIRGNTIDNDDAKAAMIAAHVQLKKAPRYSCARIDLRGEDSYKFKIIKPQ